jgi:hypothetical protein
MQGMRLVARLTAVVLVGAFVIVIGLAAGRALTAVRQTPEPSFEPFAPPPAAVATGALALPVQCAAPIAVAASGRFTDLAWSPDSGTLAATTAPPGESPARITLFYGSDWKAHDIGPGRGPRWSLAGLLAFERPDRAGTLRIVDARSGHEVGQIADTSGAYAWDGEALVFFRGSELRTWRDGTEELRAVVGSSYAPGKPYLARFSGDGSRFVVERRENGKIAELFIGDTTDGRASPLAAPVSYSFAPSGKRLILDYADRLTLFAEAKASATVLKTDIAGTFAGWSPDGRRVLFRTSSSALLGWDVMRVDEVARTATGSGGELAFAPSGPWLASLNSGSLTLAPCADLGADPRVKLTRDEAIHLVRSRPDVLGVTKIEAKLVLWAELERNHAKGMFPSSFGPADPNAPVWLVGVAGEVRRPANWNPSFALDTYPLGLYALDASDGHELTMQVTNGTWWIGDGFDDLHEYGTLPPAWTPATNPYPTPVLPVDYTVTTQGASSIVQSQGGWSVAVPKEWFVSSDAVRFGAAVVTNHQPDVYGSYTVLVMPRAPARLRLTLEIWSNDKGLGLGDWVSQVFPDGITTHVTDRTTTTLAGRQAEVLTKDESFGPPPLGQQTSRVWIVPATDETMLVVSALPADSTSIGDAERALRTLRLLGPTAAPKATVAKADAMQIATGAQATSPTGKPQPAIRIDRSEAKLVRWMDLRSVVGPFQGPFPGPLSRAPDDPVWVVAIAGDLGMTSGICRGPGGCQPQAIGWKAIFVDARTGAVSSSLNGPAGAWPAFFDSLPDRPF